METEIDVYTSLTPWGARVVRVRDQTGATAEVMWSGRADPALLRIASREAIRLRCREITDAARQVPHAR